jgi:diacylglycerol kinase family enzyme
MISVMTSQASAISSATCILNGKSAHLRAALTHIARISDEFGVEVQTLVTKRGDDISSLVEHALAERQRLIVAGGGDGTVNAVAGKLAGTDAVLGILPMGTLNHFAKDAGIPVNLDAAVRNLFTGRATKVDVGEVNGRIFVNNSGIGFYPHFVRLREEEERLGHVKRLAFVLALRSFVRRYFRLRIKEHMATEDALEHMTPFLFVGNNRYQTSGLAIGTRPRLDSGRLWVCTAPCHGRPNVMRVALRILLGRESDRELNAFEAEEIWVDPKTTRVNVSTDGEVSMMEAPLHYRIRARALTVVLPERRSQPVPG